MSKTARDRLQIDLTASHRRLLQSLSQRLGSSGDAETARRVFDVFENLTDTIQQGFKLVVVPTEDEHPDAIPELTRALRPESRYNYLVKRPHAWRKQLFFKGRRLTVGQFLAAMHANKLTPEEAATDFDLPTEAAYEAIDYGDRFAALITAENEEDAAAVMRATHAHPPR